MFSNCYINTRLTVQSHIEVTRSRVDWSALLIKVSNQIKLFKINSL